MLSIEEFKTRLQSERVRKVTLDSWGQDFYLLRWNMKERTAYITSINKRDENNKPLPIDEEQAALEMAASCICDENGQLLYKPEDLTGLKDVDGKLLQDLFLACTQLNLADPEKLAELGKNSETSQS